MVPGCYFFGWGGRSCVSSCSRYRPLDSQQPDLREEDVDRAIDPVGNDAVGQRKGDRLGSAAHQHSTKDGGRISSDGAGEL